MYKHGMDFGESADSQKQRPPRHHTVAERPADMIMRHAPASSLGGRPWSAARENGDDRILWNREPNDSPSHIPLRTVGTRGYMLMAESVGFEPTVVLATTVFKTVPLNRSGNSPGLCPFMLLPRYGVVNCTQSS